MFKSKIWDKLLECIFENVEIAQVKNNFKIWKNRKGNLSAKLPKSNMWWQELNWTDSVLKNDNGYASALAMSVRFVWG